MSARCIVHTFAIAFAVFVVTLNALGPNAAPAYLVAGAVGTPSLLRFLGDRRKVQPGAYGASAPRPFEPARPGYRSWTPSDEPGSTDGPSCRQFSSWACDDPRVAKVRRLVDNAATPGERAAAEAALARLRSRPADTESSHDGHRRERATARARQVSWGVTAR